MTVLNKGRNRSRIVMFRLSPDEYASLRSACLAANCRSISDYMRTELLELAQPGPADPAIHNRFSEIEQRLMELQRLIQDISVRISTFEPACGESSMAHR